jgi:hypothetical protein
MKKLTGSDIVTILKSSSKNADVLHEAQNLTINDFNTDDPSVRMFLTLNPDGFRFSSDKTSFNNMASAISSINKEILEKGMRKAYSNLQALREANSDAIEYEKIINEEKIIANAETQLKTATLLNSLSKYAHSSKHSQKLFEASENVSKGKFNEASDCVRNVFAEMNPEKNIKVAFTTLKNQMGESYQLCPKGIYIWGQPRPMPISDCREYCIDARLHQDGTVGCNYLNWLNENLITQKQALNLFDTIKQANETMNLKEGERTKFPLSDQDQLDARINRSDNINDTPWEKQLSESHDKKKEAQKPKANTLMTDAALETLLKDVRDVFDEDELATLEERLREAMGE